MVPQDFKVRLELSPFVLALGVALCVIAFAGLFKLISLSAAPAFLALA